MTQKGPPPGSLGTEVALSSWKNREKQLEDLEAQMVLFEQEVLGVPVTDFLAPAILTMEPAPVIRPVITTDTYHQVQQSLEAQTAAASSTVIDPIVGLSGPFVDPVGFSYGRDRDPLNSPKVMDIMLCKQEAVPWQHPPNLCPSFIPRVLQKVASDPYTRNFWSHQSLVRSPQPGASEPLMVLPPMAQVPESQIGMTAITEHLLEPQEIDLEPEEKEEATSMTEAVAVGPGLEEAGAAIEGSGTASFNEPILRLPLAMPLPKFLHLGGIQGPLPPQQIPDLLSLRPSNRSQPGPPLKLKALEVPESLGENKKKGKSEKPKCCIRTAGGRCWEDPSLLEWDADDFRIFCGDLGKEVNDDILARAFRRFPSFLKAKVICDKHTGKNKGYGFVSFKDSNDYVHAIREMNGKYVGSRPIKLRKSTWKDRNLDVVRKKQKEKKKLGFR